MTKRAVPGLSSGSSRAEDRRRLIAFLKRCRMQPFDSLTIMKATAPRAVERLESAMADLGDSPWPTRLQARRAALLCTFRQLHRSALG